MSAPRLLRGRTAPLDDVTIARIYGRVSSDEQEKDGVSLADQLATNRRYCASNEFVIGGEYQDVQSGMKAARADYQRLLADVRADRAEGRRAAVVVKFQDRLGRNLLESAKVYDELQKLGVEVHVAESGRAPSEDEYILRAFVAHIESRNIRARTKSAYRHLAEKGWHRPGQLPWGYALRPRTVEERADDAPQNVMVIDPVQAAYVRDAFARVAAGTSIREVARWVATLPDVARGGRKLTYNTVRKLLSAPVYVGRGGGPDHEEPEAVLERPAGRWEPLVTEDTWRQVASQRRLAGKMPNQASGEFVLSGLLRCARCGERMQGRTRPLPSGPRREYCCSSALVLGTEHIARPCWYTVPADPIEDEVERTISGTLKAAGEPTARRAIIRDLQAQAAAPDADALGQQIRELEMVRTRTQDRMHNLTIQLTDGVVDAEAYKDSAKRLRDQLDATTRTLEDLRRARPRAAAIGPLDALLGSCAGWARVLASGDVAAVRAVYGLLLEDVTPMRVARGRYQVDPTPTESGMVLLEAAVVALRQERSGGAKRLLIRLVAVGDRASSRHPTLTMSALLGAQSENFSTLLCPTGT